MTVFNQRLSSVLFTTIFKQTLPNKDFLVLGEDFGIVNAYSFQKIIDLFLIKRKHSDLINRHNVKIERVLIQRMKLRFF